MRQIEKYIKKYFPVIILGILFLYCYLIMPLAYDQYVSNKLYIHNQGIINWITGYCWYWVTSVNGRFFSVLITGFLEQNRILNTIGMTATMILIPLLGLKIFSVPENQKKYFLLVNVLGLMIVGIELQETVYFYAGMLYLGAVIIVELFYIALLSVLEGNRGNIKFFYIVCVIGAFWLETLTATLLVCSICLLLYQYIKKKEWSYHLMGAGIIFSIALVVMAYGRQSAIEASSGSLLASIHEQTVLVLRTTFYQNAGVTLIISIVLLIHFIERIVKNKENILRIVIYSLFTIFLCYMCILHALVYYNNYISDYCNVNEDISRSIIHTSLQLIPQKYIGFQDGWFVITYLILIGIMIDCAIHSKHQRSSLTILCAAICMIGIPCILNEHFGVRIIAPGLELLSVYCAEILLESFSYINKDIKKTFYIFSIIILLVLADGYYVRCTNIAEKYRRNLEKIELCRKAQLEGTWDYENDILKLESSGFHVRVIPSNNNHFIYFSDYYGISEKTEVSYY